MTREELIEAVSNAEINDLVMALAVRLPDPALETEILILLESSERLDTLIDAAVAEETRTLIADRDAAFEETRTLIADRDAAFDEGKESAVSDMTGDLMEMLAEGRIEDAGQYLESLGSDRPWYVFKAGALTLGRLSL